jgi:Cytochrome P460
MQQITRTVQRKVFPETGAGNTMDSMISPPKSILLLAVALLGPSLSGVSLQKASNSGASNTPTAGAPQYAADGQLKLPEHYREWIYLSSDFYVVTDPAKTPMGLQKGFIDVFVNPGAHRSFLQTGTWADKTMFVAELRGAEDMGSNPTRQGNAQSSVIGVNVHVKDTARFPGQWAFFNFKGDKTAKMLPVTDACYSCHAVRGAVDTTFVQFYPTLLAIAKSNNTLSTAYSQENQSAAPTTK